MIRLFRSLLIGILLVCLGGLVPSVAETISADAPEPHTPEPGRLWFLYSASTSDHEGRMIGWWGKGWDTFADHTIPNHLAGFEATCGLRVYGIQVHHPWGRTVTNGKPIQMEFDQRINCYRDYKRTGNKKLLLAMDDNAFLRAMNTISKHHRLMVYTGSPHFLEPLAGEDTDAWVERAKMLLGPTLSVVPPPAIGLDATYGQPYLSDPNSKFRFTGGKEGAVAQLVRDLTSHGHEVFFEGGILFDAKWALEICSTYSTQQNWRTVNGKRPHYKPEWGRWARPQEETSGTTMIQLQQRGLSAKEKHDEIWKHLRLGRDVVVTPSSMPGYPWQG